MCFRTGTLPNITRNALVNATELVSYDLIKEAILKHKLLSGTKSHSRAENQKPKQVRQRFSKHASMCWSLYTRPGVHEETRPAPLLTRVKPVRMNHFHW